MNLTSVAAMRLWFLALSSLAFAAGCRSPVQSSELQHETKYLAAFAAPALITPDDDKRINSAFQSKYRSRVILLKPVAGQAYLRELGAKAALFAMIKVNSLRDTRVIVKEIEVAMGNASLISLFPLAETNGSQDNFSGMVFHLALEKRAHAFNRLTGKSKSDIFRSEADDFSQDRNLLSYFSSVALSDTPYQTVRLLGFSGVTETQFETYDGLYARAVRKLDYADTAVLEKIR